MTNALLTIASILAAPFLWAVDVANIDSLYSRVTSLENTRIEAPLGAIQAVAGKKYYLAGGGISSSATSMTLTSFQTPVSNYNLSMSDFGDIGYLTIEPGSETRQEFVSFTGVTQNADGTATISGLSRGLSPVSPYTASTTIQKSHAGGSVVVISNPPQLYNAAAFKANNETITGQWTFSTFPITPSNGTSSVNVAGVSQLATPSQQAAGTATSTNGTSAPLVLSSQYATSTWNSNSLAANLVPILGTTGQLNNNFISTTTLVLNTASSTFTNVYATSVFASNLGVKLVSTTTTAAMTYATTTTFGSYQYLTVELIVAAGTNEGVCMSFNNDTTAGNYGSKVFREGVLDSLAVTGSVYLATPNLASSTVQYFTVDIYNPASSRKQLNWHGSLSASAAQSPVLIEGGGVWNNTTQQIDTIVLNGASNPRGCQVTIPSGTVINVYGRN